MTCDHDYDCGGVKRFWTYPRYDYEPPRRWLPSIGGDEHDQWTIVLPIPFAGWLVIALGRQNQVGESE